MNKEKELLEKICIVLVHKWGVCDGIWDIVYEAHDTFESVWSSWEISENMVIDFLKEIDTPKKELLALAKKVIQDVKKYIIKCAEECIEEKIIPDIILVFDKNEDPTEYWIALSDYTIGLYKDEDVFEGILKEQIKNLDVKKIKERTQRWLNKKENKNIINNHHNAHSKNQIAELKRKHEKLLLDEKTMKAGLRKIQKEIKALEAR